MTVIIARIGLGMFALASACCALAGCATHFDQPTRTSSQALSSIDHALRAACLPLAKGDIGLEEAKRILGIRETQPVQMGFDPPPRGPFFTPLPGNVQIVIQPQPEGPQCSLNIKGNDPGLSSLVEHAVRDAMPAEYGTRVEGLSKVPGQKIFCVRDVFYSYSELGGYDNVIVHPKQCASPEFSR